jgi:hypothetical protein
MNFDGAPCTNHPGFLQPAEQPDWATNPETVDAINICNTCPLQLQCLHHALTAGDLAAIPGDCDAHRQPPSGAIYGGVVCDGTPGSARELLDRITQLSPTPIRKRVREPRPSHCTDCSKPMVGNTETPSPGQVRHEARGLCINCGARHRYRNQHRKAA